MRKIFFDDDQEYDMDDQLIEDPNSLIDDYDDFDDEDVDMQGYDSTYSMDGTDQYDDDQEEIVIVKVEPKTLVGVLRDELKLKEPDRGILYFRHQGSDYAGVPLCELNPNKFVFNIIPENKPRSFTLSEIQLIKK